MALQKEMFRIEECPLCQGPHLLEVEITFRPLDSKGEPYSRQQVPAICRNTGDPMLVGIEIEVPDGFTMTRARPLGLANGSGLVSMPG